MATTMYLWGPASVDAFPPGNIGGLGSVDLNLDFVRDSAAATSFGTQSVAGPTAGVQVMDPGGANPLVWWSPHLSAVTISGTITFNVWMSEASMSCNAGAQVKIERTDSTPTPTVLSTIVDSEKGVELGTSQAVQNWTATPTSTTLNDRDRLRVTVWANDVGTMGAAGAIAFASGSPTASVDGDSFITFTETVTLAGTVFPSDVSAGVRYPRRAVRRSH